MDCSSAMQKKSGNSFQNNLTLINYFFSDRDFGDDVVTNSSLLILAVSGKHNRVFISKPVGKFEFSVFSFLSGLQATHSK